MRSAAREPSRGRWKRAGGLPRSTAERAARPGRAGEPLPHRAGANVDLRLDPLSRRPVDGASRPDPGSPLDRSRRERLAAPPDPPRLVDPRARRGPLYGLVRAPRGPGAELRGQRILVRGDPNAARTERAGECRPQVEAN